LSAVDPSDRQRGLLAVLQIWRDLFLDVSLVPVVIHGGAGAGARWVLWSTDAGPEVVDLSLFPDFVVRIRWLLVQ
jgi:hypothetical protein